MSQVRAAPLRRFTLAKALYTHYSIDLSHLPTLLSLNSPTYSTLFFRTHPPTRRYFFKLAHLPDAIFSNPSTYPTLFFQTRTPALLGSCPTQESGSILSFFIESVH
ncbi:MAG: hypothetical protein AAGJ35_01490 [Myxococcota bacterium]